MRKLREDKMSFFDTVSKYKRGFDIIADWLGSGAAPVTQEEAQERADICIPCPRNKGSTLTDGIAAAIKSSIELKNSLQLRVDGEKSLLGCEVCLCSNRLQVWTPETHFSNIPKSEASKYPEPCWKRKVIYANRA
jgi:hypothetical protein